MRKGLLILISLLISIGAQCQNVMDLSGEWSVKLECSPATSAVVNLPTTLDLEGIGAPNTLTADLRLADGTVNKQVMKHLTRKVSYVGLADYERKVNITREMANRPLQFYFERVLWRSHLYVDGKEVGESCESLSTPHIYTLSKGLSEGTHTLKFVVDNTKQYDLSYDDMAHAYTNETQTMWNGVLGRMEMSVIPTIGDVQVYPDVNESKVTVILSTNSKVKNIEFTLNDNRVKATRENDSIYTLHIQQPKLWNEFTPNLYNLTVRTGNEYRSVSFGMRNITNDNGALRINGERIFFRSTLECCIFPLTGCPPTDEQGWLSEFMKAKDWGLNSLRFHSWCPPEAAFRAADRLGFYLHVELPNWTLNIGQNPEAEAFFYREFDRIVRTYGNHPSLCLMTAGNELQKDFDYLNGLCKHMKETDPRHLYATTTFTFEKGHGGHPEPEDQFYVTQWTDKGWVRGQGVFDEKNPDLRSDYNSTASGYSVPLISHEIGQYSVYPNMDEIAKYSGTLMPLNFQAIRKDLQQKGQLQRAAEYTQASGRLAVILYKEEIERALKTRDFDGYELLGLQDFPGQSTALVGLVDAFWDSKGLCTSGFFRQFCAPVVPLARYEKATWSSNEIFTADIEVANYSAADIKGKRIQWSLANSMTDTIASGTLSASEIAKGQLNTIGQIRVPLSNIKDADKLELSVSITGSPYHNTWNIWCYQPRENDAVADKEVAVSNDLGEAMKLAKSGRKVLFYPKDFNTIKGLEGKFLPVFWSPVHFPDQAGTMGLLLHPEHPAFKHFPTDMNSDWQWWNIVKRSRVMNLDSLQGATPIIESVDNFINNRHLSLMFETKLGKGSLVFSSIDLSADLPEVRQLLYSITAYMSTDSFTPKSSVTEEELAHLIKQNP